MPLKVSPVCGFFRLSRCGCGGGRGTARTISGRTTVPAIKDRKSRRSIVLYRAVATKARPRGSDNVELYVTERHGTKQYITLPQQKGKTLTPTRPSFSCSGRD